MSEEKIVPVLNGAAETMLQSFYARAMYSKNPKHKFKDEKITGKSPGTIWICRKPLP